MSRKELELEELSLYRKLKDLATTPVLTEDERVRLRGDLARKFRLTNDDVNKAFREMDDNGSAKLIGRRKITFK